MALVCFFSFSGSIQLLLLPATAKAGPALKDEESRKFMAARVWAEADVALRLHTGKVL